MLESTVHTSVLLPSSTTTITNKRLLPEEETQISSKRRKLVSPNIFGGLESFQTVGMSDPCKTSIVPYITCNEQNQQKTLKKITQLLSTIPGDSDKDIHIGFSMWFNLDLLSVCNLKYAVILDFDPKVFLIYQILEKSLQTSSSPEEFLEIFLLLLLNDQINTHYSKDIQEFQIREQLNKGYGFLSCKENFLRVKSMCENNRIFFGSVDIVSETDMLQLSTWCKENKLIPKCLYISNISEWVLNSSHIDIFKKNLTLLMHKETLVIDAFYPSLKTEGSGPPQRITQGILPDFKKKVPDIKKNAFRPNFSGERKLLPRKLFFNTEETAKEPQNRLEDERQERNKLMLDPRNLRPDGTRS